MADLSSLGNLAPVDVLDLNDTYVDARENTFRLPAKGEYVLQAPDSFPDAAFAATKEGYLLVQIDPTITGPTNEGFQLRYQKVSAKPFDRSGVKASKAGDYLRACGFSGTLKTPQSIADAIEQTAGITYRAAIDWRAYNSKSGFTLEGMERFPKLKDGSYQSWVEDPTAKDDTGQPQRVRANLVIKRFIAAE